jgi:arylsulfatase A-like enzyme
MSFRLYQLVFLAALATRLEAAPPPVVVFLSDDHTWRDSTLYGEPGVATPHMERVAATGMTFHRAYVTSPSCAPSRASLLTGLYPANHGAEPNHAKPGADLKKLPACFQELGYEVVSFGKVGHYVQTPGYGFDKAEHFTYHDDLAIPEAIRWLKERRSSKPLCLFVGTNWPHVPWPVVTEGVSETERTPPPNHVDNPTMRDWRARYIAAVHHMDAELGAVFDATREVLGDNALFLHTSDHGAQWPFAKWNLYDDGIRTPLIVSWPGHVSAGSRSDAMVSWIDIYPTLVEAVGGKPPVGIDGISFLPVLKGSVTSHRDAIYATHSGDGSMNVYPSRVAVTSDGWKYIRNLHPEFRFSTHIMRQRQDGMYWDSWVESAETNEEAKAKVQRYQVRPAEELYHPGSDPWEMTNLAAQPAHEKRLHAMRLQLDTWLTETGDTLTVYGRPTLVSARPKPNIITVFIDDMGYSDLSCFGGTRVETQHIDRLAAEGLRFTNFYVNSPICSPSRTALTTGQYPQRWRISSFLNDRANNEARGMASWLDPSAPVLARELQAAGYTTGHFGKWHMGGQRDVGDAPLITDYGFTESLTNFEGLGPRVLPLLDAYDGTTPRPHDLGSAKLGMGEITWKERSQITSEFVSEALQFIDRAQVIKRPFFLNLWPDDVHSPFFPPKELRAAAGGDKRDHYYAVLDAMDEQLGGLFERIRDDQTLRENTLIILASDNGHEAGAGSSDPLRGAKTWLYEGGIRSPLIVWGPGLVVTRAAGSTNDTAVFSALDLNRALYTVTDIELPKKAKIDGEDVSDALLGKSPLGRVAPLFWRRPPDRPGYGYGYQENNPDLAVRDGKWKFLINFDRSDPQLYDLSVDVSETNNLVHQESGIAARLERAVFDWHATMPEDAGSK